MEDTTAIDAKAKSIGPLWKRGVKGAPDKGLPVEVTLGELALFTIVKAMRESKVQKIRDILR